MKWTNDDIKLVEKFIEIKNKGYYVDGGQLTEVYNRVLEKHVAVTNCGSCLRGRVNELEAALNEFKKLSEKASENGSSMEAQNSVSEASEAQEKVEVNNTKEEENKAVRKAGKKR